MHSALAKAIGLARRNREELTDGGSLVDREVKEENLAVALEAREFSSMGFRFFLGGGVWVFIGLDRVR